MPTRFLGKLLDAERNLLHRLRSADQALVATEAQDVAALTARPGRDPLAYFHAPPRTQQHITPATQGPDQLRLRVWSQYGFVPVVLTVRLKQADGSTSVYQTALTTAVSPDLVAETFVDGSGDLVSASIIIGPNAPVNVARGDVFAQLDYARKINNLDTSVATVLQGYVARAASLAFPGSPIQSPYDGPGRPLSRSYSDGAVGSAQVVLFVPTGNRFRIIDITCGIVPDATVINRSAALIFGDLGVGVVDGLFTQNMSGVIAAGQNTQVTWGSGSASTGVDPNGNHWMNISIPNDLYFVSGDKFTVFIFPSAPGDQIKNIHLRAEQWLDPQ